MRRLLCRLLEALAFGVGFAAACVVYTLEPNEPDSTAPGVACGLCGEKQTPEEFLNPDETCSCVRVRR